MSKSISTNHNTHSRRGRPLQRLAVILLLAACIVALAQGAEAHAEGIVHFYYFYQTGCTACDEIHHDVLEPLLASYGDRVAVEELDIADSSNLELLLRLEEQFDVASVSIPEVFIGEHALIGPQQIRSELASRIEHYLAEGGVDLPMLLSATPAPPTPTSRCTECAQIHESQRTAVASMAAPAGTRMPTPQAGNPMKPLIHAAYFYQVGCDECDRALIDVEYIEGKYPQLDVQRFDVREQPALNEYLSQRAGVPAEQHLTAPALFVVDTYLLGERIRAPAIEALIQPYLESGAPEPWAGWVDNRPAAESTILERFRSLGLWTVVGAGLLDGVNPCAFATMIFLVSYLAVRKREGRELLATGVSFTAGVFIAYLGIGLGLLRFLTVLPILSTMAKWIYALTLVLCLVLAWGNLTDFRKARAGRLEDMSLKLPDRLRELIRRLIREGSRSSSYVLASLLIGFAVSIVELACTGQVYLPTIVFVLGLPEWRARAALALVAYNLMFITPLIGIFMLVYLGTTSQQLTRWLTKHAATVKLGTALLFLLMAGWLAHSLVVS